MQIFGKDCGCDARREIMFTQGNGQFVVLTLVVGSVVVLLLARKAGGK